MVADVSFTQVAGSLVLIVVVVALSMWRRLDLERSVIWATVRATVQLIAVGLLFTVIFESARASLWAWLWVTAMVLISGVVAYRRAPTIPTMFVTGLVAIGVTVGLSLAIVFGLGVLDPDPVAVVVIAGITIGNTMPSAVQAALRMSQQLRSDRGQVEALLALGFDASGATRQVTVDVAKLALVPQIERTKVVGLIALPGAMTGLLLAGAEPLDAVLVQLVVMFLVLGSVATSVIVVSLAVARAALTDDLRVADWVGH